MALKTIKVTANYLQHDGGTKFYETVLIEHPDGRTMLVKRWGPMAKNLGGGQVKIERGTKSAMTHERSRILGEKRTPRSGKGKYEGSFLRWGFHGTAKSEQTIGEFTEEELVNKATNHWRDDDETRLAIARHFDIDIDLPHPGEDMAVVDESMIEDEPQPEAPRDASWGTW